MRLALGKRADYSIRAALDLARHDGEGLRTAAAIAAAMDIPRSYLPALLGTLVGAGIVTSVPGRDGGYAVARDPGEITLLEIIEAADGPMPAAECVLRGGPCRWEGHCAVHEPWSRAQDALRAVLADTTLAALVAQDRELVREYGDV